MGVAPRLVLIGALVLAACGSREAEEREADIPDDEARRMDAVVPGSGLGPGHYRLVKMGAAVTKRKGLGLKWDIVGPAGPDARFDVLLNGKQIGSCRGPNDNHEPTCRPKEHIEFSVAADTTVTLSVVDRDVSGDEPIGEASLSGLTAAGVVGKKLPMKAQGKLLAAWIELIKVDAPRSLWARYQTRVFGLIGGIAAALLLLFLFKGFWFDEKHYLQPRTIGKLTEEESSKLGSLAKQDVNEFVDPPEPPPPAVVEVVKVRCQYCAALLDEHDHTCHKCGGGQ